MSEGGLQQRLWDLVRYQRAQLHQADLITDEEYVELCADPNSRARLVGYDGLRKQIATLTAEFSALRRDKERLDWLEKEKPILNRLSLREKMNSDYWHLCWGDWAHTKHFGGEETIPLDVRAAIDAAMKSMRETVETVGGGAGRENTHQGVNERSER